MDKKERIALIRKGNECFNNGEIDYAIKIFIKTDYKDGLVRIGDYFFYEKRQPLMAFRFYKKANMTAKVSEIYERIIYALGQWIREDKTKEKAESPSGPVAINISPKLKKAAEDILNKKEMT